MPRQSVPTEKRVAETLHCRCNVLRFGMIMGGELGAAEALRLDRRPSTSP